MKLLILQFVSTLILVSSICNRTFSQPTFTNDSSDIPMSGLLFNEIDSVYQLEKDNDFEFRLWVTFSKTMKRQLFILSLKNKNWSARLFERTTYQKDTLVEVNVDQANLPKLWKSLNRNNLLTIPNSYDLKDKNGSEIDLAIHDGTSYRFELFTASNKRSYSYHCPKMYRDEFKYVKAFNNVVRIVELVYKYCKIKPAYIC